MAFGIVCAAQLLELGLPHARIRQFVGGLAEIQAPGRGRKKLLLVALLAHAHPAIAHFSADGRIRIIYGADDLDSGWKIPAGQSPAVQTGKPTAFVALENEMIELAQKNAMLISAGHSFIIFLADGFFPINVLNAIKMIPEVCQIFCATANPTEVIVGETEQGRGILGVIDGQKPLGIEAEEDITWRKNFLRQIGYKS